MTVVADGWTAPADRRGVPAPEVQAVFVAHRGYSSDATVPASRNMAPTLFVGLGGTGLQVLERFRRRLRDRFGDADYWSHFAFMAIDSDSNAWRAALSDVKRFPLLDRDLIDISMKSREVGQVFNNLSGPYRHFGEWLSPDAARWYSFDFQYGAAAIRPAGRLQFASHVAELRDLLARRFDEVTSVQALSRSAAQGAHFDTAGGGLAGPPADVVIVAGLGGGTGSGSFLDCACLVRSLQATRVARVGQVRAMLVLPDVLNHVVGPRPQLQRTYANAYAALRELEYYNRPGSATARPLSTAAWGERAARWDMQGRPFDVCHLFGKDRGAAGGARSAEEAYEMVADALDLTGGGTAWPDKFAPTGPERPRGFMGAG